uniref:Uncharacterized protein n=1 Tax=Picea sitchensis TaxID=3332 RepID=A9NLL1_PICSI|nr:unknown [Picea sitchensis]
MGMGEGLGKLVAIEHAQGNRVSHRFADRLSSTPREIESHTGFEFSFLISAS